MRIGIPRLPPLTPSSDSLSSSSPYHHLHNISHDLWPEGQSPCQLKLISLWSLVTARKHESHQRGVFFYNSVWFLHVKTYLCLLLGVDILLSKKSNENMSLAILRCTCLQTKTYVARSTTRGVSDRTIARYYAELNLYVTALYWLIIEPVFV